MSSSPVSNGQYEALAAFRHTLRRFLAFSKFAARAAGLPAQQHQALLSIKGHAGATAITVGGLAAHLLIAAHSAAELVERLVRAGLVWREEAPGDRRTVQLFLTPRAEQVLQDLSEAHLAELRQIGPVLSGLLQTIRGL